jgi:outer membrane protein assembly factor BamA
MGVGYRKPLGDYQTLDVRGSFTVKGYKRLEAEYRAPRLFDRRGVLSVVGGWREATQVGFYGLGTAPTSADDRANYGFRQPYASTTLYVRPARNWLVLAGGLEYSRWDQRPGDGSVSSVEEVYTPATLPGLDAAVTYWHASGTAAADTRAAPDYARSGGYYGMTWHAYADTDDAYSFRQVDYEAVQHLPIFRDAWVLSLRGRVETTYTADKESVPFFMLPSLGGGSPLRGFASWRFRDRNSLLLQAEWRVLVNNFLDTAVFCDAGKVTARTSDLDLGDLKSDCGIGFRLHGPLATPLRIELAKSNEGLALVFGAHASF